MTHRSLLIERCRLVEEAGQRSVVGQLFSLPNGILVHVSDPGAVVMDGWMAWEWGIDPLRLPINEYRVVLRPRVPYFAFRGVVVFSRWQAHFNALAERLLSAQESAKAQR